MTASGSLTDQQRFDQWLRQHGPSLRGYVTGMVRDRELAEDLLQEVFRRAWQARSTYRENGKARSYLLRIADRLVYDLARKPRREVQINDEVWQQVEPADRDRPPPEQLMQQEASRQLEEALDQLSEPQRRALLLRYYGQLSFQEIATTMDCPLNTALSHARRGLLALRTVLTACAK